MSSTSTDLELAADTPPAAPAVVPQAMSDDTMAMLWRESKALASSGMFKNVRQAEQAFGKLVIGHHLGVSPATSMTAIDIVEGNPTFRGTLLGTLVKSREGYDWKVREHTDSTCSIEFFRDDESQGVSTFTLADAQRAELIESFTLDDNGNLTELKAKKDNWRKYPRDMLWNRSMSRGVKQLVPETMAGIPVYVEGELDDVKGSGVVDGEPGGQRQASAATDMAKLELTVKTHVPDSQQERAITLLRDINKLAPESWGPNKIEMLLSGKTPAAVKVELDSLARQIDELRANAEHASAREGTREEPINETPSDSADADEGEIVEPAEPATAAAPGEPREPTEEEQRKMSRLSILQEQLDEIPDLTEQETSDIEAEMDALRGELPPDIGPGQESLPL